MRRSLGKPNSELQPLPATAASTGGPVPAALAQVRADEARAEEKAKEWVRATLEALFTSDAGFEPRTSREVMAMLDTNIDMPTEYARFVKEGDIVLYNKRYQWARNTLEQLARKKLVVVGATLNKFERDAATYARPRDASDEWTIEIDALDHIAKMRALRGIKEWLQLDGAVLDNVKDVLLTRKGSGGRQNGQAEAPQVFGHRDDSGAAAGRGTGTKRKPRGRKPRLTQGGD